MEHAEILPTAKLEPERWGRGGGVELGKGGTHFLVRSQVGNYPGFPRRKNMLTYEGGPGLSLLPYVKWERGPAIVLISFIDSEHRSSIVRILYRSIVFFVPSAKLSFCRTELYVRS
jgi:hypothetical protein